MGVTSQFPHQPQITQITTTVRGGIQFLYKLWWTIDTCFGILMWAGPEVYMMQGYLPIQLCTRMQDSILNGHSVVPVHRLRSIARSKATFRHPSNSPLASFLANTLPAYSPPTRVELCACTVDRTGYNFTVRYVRRSGPRYSSTVRCGTIPIYIHHFSVPNRTIPEYCASVNEVLVAHLRTNHPTLHTQVKAAMDGKSKQPPRTATPAPEASSQPTLLETLRMAHAYKRKGAKWKELTDTVTYFIATDSLPIYTVEKSAC